MTPRRTREDILNRAITAIIILVALGIAYGTGFAR